MKTTLEDPVVEEIRSVRRELTERFGDDVDALCNFLEDREKEHQERLVIRTPKTPQRARIVGFDRD